jgi:adenine-specific DNA-methyltransferase
MGRTKTNGRVFRFIRNFSKATATNVYLMLYPKPSLNNIEVTKPEVLDHIFTILQTLSDEELLREGRTYCGDLNNLEPHELARIEIDL